jgi:hypothetical protein
VHLSCSDVLELGSWVEVTATWVPGSGGGGVSPPRLRVRRWRPLVTPPYATGGGLGALSGTL